MNATEPVDFGESFQDYSLPPFANDSPRPDRFSPLAPHSSFDGPPPPRGPFRPRLGRPTFRPLRNDPMMTRDGPPSDVIRGRRMSNDSSTMRDPPSMLEDGPMRGPPMPQDGIRMRGPPPMPLGGLIMRGPPPLSLGGPRLRGPPPMSREGAMPHPPMQGRPPSVHDGHRPPMVHPAGSRDKPLSGPVMYDNARGSSGTPRMDGPGKLLIPIRPNIGYH